MINKYEMLNNLPTKFGVTNNSVKNKPIILEQNDKFCIAEFKNVSFYNGAIYKNNPVEVKLKGMYFVIQTHIQYYHFIFDCVAVFLYLKTIYKDLEPLIIIKSDDENYKENFKYIELIKHLGMYKNVYQFDDRHIVLNHVNIITVDSAVMIYSPNSSVFQWPEVFTKLRDSLYEEKEIIKNKKIYISRRDSKNRSVIKDEEKIEAYFTNIGYDSVILSELDVFEQKALLQDAEIIVGRSGSSFTNMIFMSKDTTIIDITTEADYTNSEYKKIASAFNLNHINIYVDCKTADCILTKLNQFATIIK